MTLAGERRVARIENGWAVFQDSLMGQAGPTTRAPSEAKRRNVDDKVYSALSQSVFAKWLRDFAAGLYLLG